MADRRAEPSERGGSVLLKAVFTLGIFRRKWVKASMQVSYISLFSQDTMLLPYNRSPGGVASRHANSSTTAVNPEFNSNLPEFFFRITPSIPKSNQRRSPVTLPMPASPEFSGRIGLAGNRACFRIRALGSAQK